MALALHRAAICTVLSVFERYTEPARIAVVASQRLARALGHGAARPTHLLLGLLMQSHRTEQALEESGAARALLLREVMRRPQSPSLRTSHLARQSEDCCKLAVLEAAKRGQRFTHTGHLLLALLQAPEIPSLLAAVNVSAASVRDSISRRLLEPELMWIGGEDYIWT